MDVGVALLVVLFSSQRPISSPELVPSLGPDVPTERETLIERLPVNAQVLRHRCEAPEQDDYLVALVSQFESFTVPPFQRVTAANSIFSKGNERFCFSIFFWHPVRVLTDIMLSTAVAWYAQCICVRRGMRHHCVEEGLSPRTAPRAKLLLRDVRHRAAGFRTGVSRGEEGEAPRAGDRQRTALPPTIPVAAHPLAEVIGYPRQFFDYPGTVHGLMAVPGFLAFVGIWTAR